MAASKAMAVDYTFGFDKALVDTYGAKVAMFDAINGNFADAYDFTIHPYVKVPVDRDAKDAAREALSMHKGRYFVVRSGSRYEMLPGTSGMNDSERFVPPSGLVEAVESVRRPGSKYDSFAKRMGLKAEKSLPVCIQPMVAESFGTVSGHPNRDLIMADFIPGDDSKDGFTEPRHFWSDANFESTMAYSEKALWEYMKGLNFKPYAFFEEGSPMPLRSNYGDNDPFTETIMVWAKSVFTQLSKFADSVSPGYKWIMEYGKDPKSGRPAVYQFKPFMKEKKSDRKLESNDTDLAFGVCSGLKLPVMEMYDMATEDGLLRESAYAKDKTIKLMLNHFDIAKQYKDVVMAREMRENYNIYMEDMVKKRYGNEVCLSYGRYSNETELDFGEVKPGAVAVEKNFRAGMEHAGTNLIQEVPVVLFGAPRFKNGDTVIIDSDGTNATIRKCR